MPWAQAGAITSAHGTGQCVQDPRASSGFEGAGKYKVTGFDEPAGTIIARNDPGQGAYAVAGPRPGMRGQLGDNYLTGGHYGVVACVGSAKRRGVDGGWPRQRPVVGGGRAHSFRERQADRHRPRAGRHLAPPFHNDGIGLPAVPR